MVSSMPWPHFTPEKDPIPILQEVGWAPGPVWTGGKSRPHQDSIPDCPARSQSLYRLSYPAHTTYIYTIQISALWNPNIKPTNFEQRKCYNGNQWINTYGGHAPPQPKDVFFLQNMAYNSYHSTWLSWLGPENNIQQ